MQFLLIVFLFFLAAPAQAKPCGALEGKYIAYYGDVYLIKNCRRYRVPKDNIYEVTKRHKIHVAEAKDMQITKKGPDLGSGKRGRKCSDMEGQYVSFAYSDIYYVKKCRKHMLPDWETTENHMRKVQGHLSKTPEILALTWEEFSLLKPGKEIISVLDKEYFETLQRLKAQEVDILSQGEACQGIEGRFVAYYSRVYKIEKCFKRLVDGAALTRIASNVSKIKEIDSQVWISIPAGPPLALESEKAR